MKRRDFLKICPAIIVGAGCSGRKYISSSSHGLDKVVFEPIKIKNLTIPNRIVFPAVTSKYADEEGYVTPKLIDYYEHVAKGGAGLSIVSATAVRKDGELLYCGQRIDDDKYIDGLAQLMGVIKRNGSIPCIQLFHNKTEAPGELPVSEIEEIEESFAEAAYRAKTAGADMIEVHGAHGYLLSRFLSPLSNKRDDEYGGNTESRTRFLREILQRMRAKLGHDYPISCRINADEFVEGGLTLDESKYIAQILVEAGANVIDVSAGISADRIIPQKEYGRLCHAYLARGIKEYVTVPVIAVGNILDLTDAEKVIRDGDADMAAMGRALVADPYLIEKTARGKMSEIESCIQCRNCLSSMFESHLICSVNKNLS